MRAIFLFALLWACAASSATAQAPLLDGAKFSPNVKVSIDNNADLGWSYNVERQGAQYLWIRLSEISDRSTTDYTLIAADRNGRELARIAKAELVQQSDLWIGVLDGSYATLKFEAGAAPRGLSFVISDVLYQTAGIVPYSIVLPDDRESIAAYRNEPALYTPSRAVAKLIVVIDDLPHVCTGFMIDDDRMLTNEHCVNSRAICKNTTAIFGYEFDSTDLNTRRLQKGQEYKCQALIDADHKLDVALLRLERSPGKTWGKLSLNGRDPAADEQAFMIQHPAGEPKQMSRLGCMVKTTVADGRGPATDFGHSCDTLGGSSGSPVLGIDFTVIGLHHFGFQNVQPWSNQNRAVRMRHIVEWLKGK